jgi:hypothetical protein
LTAIGVSLSAGWRYCRRHQDAGVRTLAQGI